MTLSELRDRTYLDNGQSGYGTPAPWLNQRANPIDVFGRLDTVGGTSYDWQVNGPGYHGMFFDPMYGSHIMWMWSAEPGSPWSDRNMRYNFHNLTSWQYNIGPDFMQWGLNAFTNRCGYGNLDVNPVTGCEYISGHLGPSDHQYPAVSRDLTPGAGVFETDSGPPNIVSFLWPAIGITRSERVHVAMIDYPARTNLFYTNITWPDWLAPAIDLPPPAPEPGFPSHSLATSHVSNKVCITWSVTTGNLPFPGYYKESQDDGANWGDPVQIPFPPAFTPVPGETLGPYFHLSSINPFYDAHDNLHIVSSVACAASETTLYYYPCEIWHWSEATSWSKVGRAEVPESMVGDPGYNAIAATRPSLAAGDGGELFAVWEQFDPYNAEPTTLRARADIWGAGSADNGTTWSAPVRLTDPDETSKRFPILSPNLKADSLVLGYQVDLCAGFIVQSEGASTNNPIVVNTFPKSVLLSGVAEGPGTRTPARVRLGVNPNPFRTVTTIAYDVPKTGAVSLRLHDASGRVVRTLVNGTRNPGSFTATWNGLGDNGRKLVPGVYFATLSTNSGKLSKKLTLLQ